MSDAVYDDMARDLAKTGGPAFPMGGESYSQFGMTLRDYFAGQVLGPMMIAAGESGDVVEVNQVSNLVYRIADAMLAERAKS